ncbi:MAG: PilN domain-containing protein [Eubacteriales bacterium]
MRDINLLPHGSKRNKRKNSSKLMLISFMGVLLMVAFYMGVFLTDYAAQREIAAIENQMNDLQDIQSRREKLEGIKAEVLTMNNIIEDLKKKNTNHLLLMQEIEGCTPSGIQFSEQTSENGMMVIRGTAKNDNDIAQFAENLHGLEDIKDIWINTTEFKEEIQFEVSFIYHQQERVEEQ